MKPAVRFWGVVLIVFIILMALVFIPKQVGATVGCDWYLQHPPSPEHPDGWGECMWFTPTPNPTDVIPPTEVVKPTDVLPTSVVVPTDPVSTETVPTTVGTTPASTPQSTPKVVIQSKKTCERKCVYNQSGIPGTHAVTAVSPEIAGPYYWQIKFKDAWYDVYDCNGLIVATYPESRGETTITRLTVDGSAPTDATAYRIVGGAAAILFDDKSY